MNFDKDYGTEDLSHYQVHSPKEIIALLRSIGERNQLVRMVISGGNESVVTSILKIDEANRTVIIDCGPTATVNQRIEDSENISFETVLENIRIMFGAPFAERCMYEGLPAFRIALPGSLVRLQRREFYRVPTPISNPVLCTLTMPATTEAPATALTMALHNISGGGIALVDEKKLLDTAIGHIYYNCKLDLPGGGVQVDLQVRNSHEITFSNGRSIRRVGCMFVDLPKGADAAVQRYITRLEREQNAKVGSIR